MSNSSSRSRTVAFAELPERATTTDSHTTAAAAAAAPESSSNNNNNATSSSSSSSSSLQCPNCGSHQIEQHCDGAVASGASVCVDCGVVVEENAIVNTVEFVDNVGGGSGSASAMVGQFVSATSSKAYSRSTGPGARGAGGGGGGGALRGSRYGFSRDSRETTLANGRRRIQEVASRLRLGSTYVDAAHRLFTVAVEKNFVQGRRTLHVVAACLYIACRQEKSQHMLIDFSDALQINVYTIGTCFLKFRRLLGLKLEILDPALYVYRFAAHLDLGRSAKSHAVALTALRIVGRMKRDWMVAGRRPAGICAAALLIAARAHGFDKSHHDVTKVLRVCGWTVCSRVREFEQTPSAQLTLPQFNVVDLEQEADPPIYTRNKLQEARARALQEGNIQLLASGTLDDVGRRNSTFWRDTKKQGKKNPHRAKFQQLYQTLDQELSSVVNNNNNQATSTEVAVAAAGPAAPESTQEEEEEEEEEGGAGDHQMEIQMVDDTCSTTANNKQPQSNQLVTSSSTSAAAAVDLSQVPEGWKQVYPRTKAGKILILPNHATAEERQASVAPVQGKLNFTEWKAGLPDSIDKEVDGFFRDEQEEKQKELIFNKLNKDYLEQQERKESERLSAEAASQDQAKQDVAQAQGHARYKSSRNKRRREQQQGEEEGEEEEGEEALLTTEEQLLAAVSSRKISRKINYDALSSIFDEDGSFSTDVMANNTTAEQEAGIMNDDTDVVEDPMFEMM